MVTKDKKFEANEIFIAQLEKEKQTQRETKSKRESNEK